MLLYAITARTLFPGNEQEKRSRLISQARVLAQAGVHYLQIREKDLGIPELRTLAAAIVETVRSEGHAMQILLNGPAETALQAGCDGVHLPGKATTEAAATARHAYALAGRTAALSAACHALADIQKWRNSVDLLLFAPVFEKTFPEKAMPGAGLAVLSAAVQAAEKTPVLALGGVTAQNAPACIQAGAAGIAAIRLFTTNEWKFLIKAK